ncbi:nicotinate-nicotinamide nucleotide adenylyltransferase, partial [Vreelandella nigrificans]
MSQKTLRVGMLGGTFDPVHLGHLRSAVEVREALGLDRLHMIPAPQPPLRQAP